MQHDLSLVAGLAFVIAGAVKGTLGIGLPITALGILSQFMDPRLAVALSILPIFAANLWQVIRSGQFFKPVKRYWPFLLVMTIVLLSTTAMLSTLPVEILEAALGLIVIIFVITNLMGRLPPLPDRYDLPAQLITGVISGAFGGLSGIWAPPLFIYLLARRVEKEAFVRTTGALLLLGAIPLMIGYWQAGQFTGSNALLSAILIIPTLIGFALGEQIRRHIDARRFRLVVLIAFFLIGLNLLRQAII